MKVIFRKFRATKEIIALLPNNRWSNDGSITSYMHTGQHAGVDYTNIIRTTVPASEDEYKPLLNELVNTVGYLNLQIIKRYKHAKL